MGRRGRNLYALVGLVAGLAGLSLSGCEEGPKALSVAGISPKMGPYMGGDPVIIAGAGFQGGAPSFKVYFGKNAAKKAIVLSDTEIRVDPPGGEVGQPIDVEIVFDDSRTAKMPKAYQYIDPAGKTPQ